MAEEKSENKPRSLIQYERMKTHPVLWRNTFWSPPAAPWRMHPLLTSGFSSSLPLHFPQAGLCMFVLLQFLDPRCSRTFSPKVGLKKKKKKTHFSTLASSKGNTWSAQKQRSLGLPSTWASGQRCGSPVCKEEADRGEGSQTNPDFPSLMEKELLTISPGREDLGFEGATGGDSGGKRP